MLCLSLCVVPVTLCCVCPSVLCLPLCYQTHGGASEAEKVLQHQSNGEEDDDGERVEHIRCSNVARLSEVTCLLPEPPPANLLREGEGRRQGRREERTEERREEG